MTPYYQDEAVTIYHGDCREILPSVSADVLITDPPYGVMLGTGDTRGAGHSLAKASYRSYVDSTENWHALVPPVISSCLSQVKRGAIFAGKHVTSLPEPACVGGFHVPAAVGRNPWGYSNLATVFFYGCNPRLKNGSVATVKVSNEPSEVNGHPCPKPYGWMVWLIELCSLDSETVLDPFAGSGTTLAAAKQFGRKAIGVEMDEFYCEIAAKRCAQGVLDFS